MSTPPLPPGYALQDSLPPLPKGYKLAPPKASEDGEEIPAEGFSQGHYLKKAIPGGGDLLHAIGLPANAEEWRQRGEQEENKTMGQRAKDLLPLIVPPGFPVIKSMAKEAWRAAKDPLNPEAPLHAFSAMNPFSAPITDQMSEQGLGTKEANATGIVGAGTLAAGELLPPVASAMKGKLLEMAPNASAKTIALAKLAQKEIGKVPFLGAAGDLKDALMAKANPQLALFNKTPKLGNSPLQPPPFPGTEAMPQLSATPFQDAIEAGAPKPKPANLTESGNPQKSNLSKNQKQLQAFKDRQKAIQEPDFPSGEQGGHAGGGAVSEEELSRPGNNYVVPKQGFPSHRGIDFDPGSTPSGSTHVTVLKKPIPGPGEYNIGNGYVYKINDGQQLSPAQFIKLKAAVLTK